MVVEQLKAAQAQADIAASLHALKMEWAGNKMEHSANQRSSAPEIRVHKPPPANQLSTKSVIPVAPAPTTVPACADSAADCTDISIISESHVPGKGSSKGAIDLSEADKKLTCGAQDVVERTDAGEPPQFCRGGGLRSCSRQQPPKAHYLVDTFGSCNSNKISGERSEHVHQEPVHVISKPSAGGVPPLPRESFEKFFHCSAALTTTRGNAAQEIQKPSGNYTCQSKTGSCNDRAWKSVGRNEGSDDSGVAWSNGRHITFSCKECDANDTEGENAPRSPSCIEVGHHHESEYDRTASAAANYKGVLCYTDGGGVGGFTK